MNREQPNYILKFNEVVRIRDKEPLCNNPIKLATIVVLIGLITASFIYRIVPQMLRIALILILIRVTFSGNSTQVESPIEIRFHDKYLIVYREKSYYSKRLSRKEFDKFFYKDIREIEYRKPLKKFNIFGIVEGTWYDYKKDGSLPEKATYHKTTDSSSYFYITELEASEIISEIEENTPLKVAISED